MLIFQETDKNVYEFLNDINNKQYILSVLKNKFKCQSFITFNGVHRLRYENRFGDEVYLFINKDSCTFEEYSNQIYLEIKRIVNIKNILQ